MWCGRGWAEKTGIPQKGDREAAWLNSLVSIPKRWRIIIQQVAPTKLPLGQAQTMTAHHRSDSYDDSAAVDGAWELVPRIGHVVRRH